MANGYDLASEAMMKTQAKRMAESPAVPATPQREAFKRPPLPPRPTASSDDVEEAAGNKRSDGQSSQDKNGANRYDTSTPEKRRKALAAARRSGNPDDLKKLRGKVAESALEPPQYPRESYSSGDDPNLGEAPLNAKKRNALSKSSFALPGQRAYPIPDLAHARNALARVAQNGTPAEQRAVRAAVYRKFPQLNKSTRDPNK